MAVEPASFRDLPRSLRIGMALASGGGLLTAVWIVTNELPAKIRGTAVLGVTLGIMAVGLLLVLYTQVVKRHKARKAKPMEQQVLRSAGAGRQGISDPEQLARIDDLRKKFEEGIGTFQAAGKSLYSLPWYVILGEPGSGKTEAIRHCGIGFPPGLHDRYQGVGGTINMNWWFTDHGVIIDTAGRLMFEEASSGGTSEWKEFLSLMRKFRPNCPINGTLLVIPCDSLIRDSEEEIEQKASQIAQQFDMIQRTLDVRFPVYVVVTKSDLINGFREFFDSVSDPQLQHQILGWSNPTELDKPYDPRFVDTYLEEMKTRLFRTRLTRLGEVLADESEEQEKPATDALYAFPYAFEQLGPRLKRYLDLIFSVGSQWSCKPLFFRGIYFTSSMQEGAALDEDLAAALGVPVESLPEGPVWRRDRAYFLRDLFTNKVFREWGLVTRATNARKLYARRRAVVMACAAVSLFVLIFLTAYGGFQFRRSVGALENQLVPAVDEEDSLQIVARSPRYDTFDYKGDTELGNGTPLHAYFAGLAGQADNWRQSKGIPLIFRPAVRWEIGDQLQEAARNVYLRGVLQPFVSAAAEMMPTQNDRAWTWENDEPHALYHLIALRGGRSFDRQATTALLDSFMQYVQPRDAETYAEHKAALADPLPKLYEGSPCSDFDDTLLAQIDEAIAAGVGSFNAYWSSPQSEHSELNVITEVVRSLTGTSAGESPVDANNFADIEKQFIGKYAAVDPNTDLWEQQLEKDFEKLANVKLCVDRAASAMERRPSLRQAWLSPVDKHVELVNASYRRLMEAFPEGVPDSNQVDSNLAAHYKDLEAHLEACVRNLNDQGYKDRLGRVDDEFWANGLYDLRFGMYQTAVDRLRELRQTRIADIDSLRDTLQADRRLVQQDEEKIQGILKLHSERHRVKEGCQAALALLRCGDRRLCRDVVMWWLANMPVDALSLERYVRRDSNDRYNLTATAQVFSVWDGINRDCQISQMSTEIQERFRRVSQEYAKYARAYIDYCLTDRGRTLLTNDIPNAEDWKAYRAWVCMTSRTPTDVFKQLELRYKELKNYLSPVENCPHGSTMVPEFDAKWASLYNRFDQQRCEDVLDKWCSLGEDSHDARAVLLRSKPDEFIETYFVSPSDPPIASPDCYWYEVAVTALNLLAGEADKDFSRELDAVKNCVGKFPLGRWGNENLTASDVERIQRFSERFLAGTYAPGTVGDGANTGNREIDAFLDRLRTGTKPPDWIRNTDILPPARGQYGCQVYEIKTTPTARVRRVVLTKGPESSLGPGGTSSGVSITWNDMGRNTKPVGRAMSYDCSTDAVQLAFYSLPNDGQGELLEKPKLFKGPWAWHRMLENHDFEKDSSTYVLKHTLTVGEEPVTVEIRLRFFKEPDCSGSPIEVFASTP